MKEDSNNQYTLKATVVLALIGIVAAYLWFPDLATYRLKAGHAACVTEEDVVTYRGASLFGLLARAQVLAKGNCIPGPIEEVKLIRKARGGNLLHTIEIQGRQYFADYDALEKT